MIGIVIIAIIFLLAVLFIGCYNKLTKESITVDEAFSTMDVYLKKRFDLIPNLVETVKGYAKHEAETLSSIIEKRSHGYTDMTQDEKIHTSASISQMIPKILALAESYPDLKANANFQNLSMQLERMEEDIANSRKYYNGAVKRYNTSVQTIPCNIIAGIFHFEPKTMYEISNDEERENVNVTFE
ncbi:MAG: LemA family protein [Eubacterium sp.]